MTRMQAETLAAANNSDKAKTNEGRSYAAERSLTAESEWAVVTYQRGKPTRRQYA